MDDRIPPERRAAVEAAIQSAFGRRPSLMEPVGGGLSGAGVWRLEVEARAYLMKLDRPADGFNDPARQYACLRIASDAGVAPPLLYADAESGVSISAFHAGRPLSEHPGGRQGLIAELANLTRRLHEAPFFPPLIGFFDGVAQLISGLQPLGATGPAEIAEPLTRLAQIERAWAAAPAEPLVSSHNDLHPRNILFDGERVWLIDWEAAFLNDRWVDVAVLANYFAADEAEIGLLLGRYLGRTPDAMARARLDLMRPVCRLYYGAVLIASAGPGTAVDWSGAPSLSGPPQLETPAGRARYGCGLIAQALAACRTGAHLRALEVVAYGRGSC